MRDEDLEDEEFQIEDTCPNNPNQVEEKIKEVNLNIDWTDEESIEGVDDDRARAKSDDG